MKRAAPKKGQGRILIVEDNTDSRDILAKLLRMSGYEVTSASDGESGYVAALERVPDLIITDINMPVMSGIELLKKVWSPLSGMKRRVTQSKLEQTPPPLSHLTSTLLSALSKT